MAIAVARDDTLFSRRPPSALRRLPSSGLTPAPLSPNASRQRRLDMRHLDPDPELAADELHEVLGFE